MPQPLCTPASENAYRTLAIVGFAVVSAFAWAVFVYTGYVQGRKGLLSAPGSHTPASALSRGSMKTTPRPGIRRSRMPRGLKGRDPVAVATSFVPGHC
jgi:hypothetical protein